MRTRMKVLSRVSLLLFLAVSGGQSASIELELERDAREESGSGSGSGDGAVGAAALGRIDVCFICDGACNQFSGNGDDRFLYNLIQRVNALYNGYIPLEFVYGGPVVRIASPDFGRWQDQPDASLYAYLNNQFWRPLFKDKFRRNCGVAFLVTNSPALTAGGIASFASMCSEYSYGILKMKAPDAMVIHLAHELGHLLGIFHDDVPVNSDFLLPAYDLYNGALKTDCSGDYGCPDDKCVMASAIQTSRANEVTKFSRCSLAYYKFWATFPAYDHSCVQGSTGY